MKSTLDIVFKDFFGGQVPVDLPFQVFLELAFDDTEALLVKVVKSDSVTLTFPYELNKSELKKILTFPNKMEIDARFERLLLSAAEIVKKPVISKS